MQSITHIDFIDDIDFIDEIRLLVFMMITMWFL